MVIVKYFLSYYNPFLYHLSVLCCQSVPTKRLFFTAIKIFVSDKWYSWCTSPSFSFPGQEAFRRPTHWKVNVDNFLKYEPFLKLYVESSCRPPHIIKVYHSLFISSPLHPPTTWSCTNLRRTVCQNREHLPWLGGPTSPTSTCLVPSPPSL